MLRWIVLLLCCLALAPTWAQDADEVDEVDVALSPEVADLLDQLEPVVGPPPGAQQMVLIMAPQHGLPGRRERTALGWLVGRGEAQQVVLLGGVTIDAPPPEARFEVALLSEAEAYYLDGEYSNDLVPKVGGDPAQEPLIHAVWMRALGRDDLAARAYAEGAEKYKDGGWEKVLDRLAKDAATRVQEAYVRGEDVYAWGVIEWLHDNDLPRLDLTDTIAERLSVAAKEGRLGAQVQRPAAWDRWSDAKRLAWTLDVGLPELSSRIGSVRRLLQDELVQEVFRQGDAAMPELIRRVASDTRPTRFVHRTRGKRHLLRVQHAALVLAWELIGVRIRPDGEESSRLPRLDDPVAQAALLDAFWAVFASQPPVERLTALAQDPESAYASQAAEALADLGPELEALGTTLNPAVAQDEPRAARAILGQYVAAKRPPATLLEHLLALGDTRIAGEVAAATSAMEPRSREQLLLAEAAARLGAPGPLNDWFAWAVDPDEPEAVERRDDTLEIASRNEQLGLGYLNAVFAPDHPWSAELRDAVFALARNDGYPRRGRSRWSKKWPEHPLLLTLLLPALHDETPTGRTWEVQRSFAVRSGRPSQRTLLRYVGEPEELRETADERVCDLAGAWFAARVLGAPQVHALRLDNDDQLARARQLATRCRFRPLSAEERRSLRGVRAKFVPDLGPLDGPATQADVEAGRALFHLPDSVGPHWVPLPAVAQRQGTRTRVLIVQSELDAAGKITYAILDNDGLQLADPDALDGEPIPVIEAALGRPRR